MNTNEMTMAQMMEAMMQLASESSDNGTDRATFARRRFGGALSQLRSAAAQASAALDALSHVEDFTKRKYFREVESFLLTLVSAGAKSRRAEVASDEVGMGGDEKDERNPWRFRFSIIGPNGERNECTLTGSTGRRLWKLASLTKRGEYCEPFVTAQVTQAVADAGWKLPERFRLVVVKWKEDDETGLVDKSMIREWAGENENGIRLFNPGEIKGIDRAQATYTPPTNAEPEPEPEPEPETVPATATTNAEPEPEPEPVPATATTKRKGKAKV